MYSPLLMRHHSIVLITKREVSLMKQSYFEQKRLIPSSIQTDDTQIICFNPALAKVTDSFLTATSQFSHLGRSSYFSLSQNSHVYRHRRKQPMVVQGRNGLGRLSGREQPMTIYGKICSQHDWAAPVANAEVTWQYRRPAKPTWRIGLMD